MIYYSFVIICYNQWNLTEQAINTLCESFSPSIKKKGIEIIVINNGSEDETKIGIEQAKERLKQDIEIVPVHLDENMGWLIATNIGYAKARGEIITLLNNDLIFPKNWFDGIVRTLEENPSIGACGPTLSYGIGGIGVRLDSLQEINDFGKTFMEDNKNNIAITHRIGGGCLSVKRALFSQIGGNDYWFGMGWHEDGDWSLRTRISGYKIAIIGASFVYHLGYSTPQEARKYKRAAIESNGPKLARKWNISRPRDRKAIIENTAFSRGKHTFPCRIEDFNPPLKNQDTANSEKKTTLFVADWTNTISQWKNKLLEVKNEALNGTHTITLWIPKNYYPENEVKTEVAQLLGENHANIEFYFEEVPPIDLLKYFNQYNHFCAIKEDFVNLYFKYLIEQAALDIEVI